MIRHYFLFFMITFLAALFFWSGCSSPKAVSLTPEEKALNMASFDEVWGTINDEYWDPTFNGLDWAAVGDALRPEMEKACSRDEARDILYDMFLRLGLSHYAVFPEEMLNPEEEKHEPEQNMAHTGFELRVLDGHALVTSVDVGSSAETRGVKLGWEVIRVKEIDIKARLEERAEQLKEDDLSRTVHMAFAVIPLLMGPVDSTVEVTFLDGQGQEQVLVLTRAMPKGKMSSMGHLTGLITWIKVRELEGGTGYIAFNGFFDPMVVMKTYNESLKRFLHAPGLIIDLRGNGGGMGQMAMGMLGWLVEEKIDIGTLYTRDNELTFKVQPRPETYQGPLAVLVDGFSGSASEFFANGLQEQGRARIFGTRTKGEALPGQFKKLPNGDVFLYATSNFITAKGISLEGLGVIPDEGVDHTREALLQNRDRVIEAAVEWIRKSGG